jgi:hypothetical protein
VTVNTDSIGDCSHDIGTDFGPPRVGIIRDRSRYSAADP